ncbi:uncharacterized protein V6R79_004060 [Siganus canaliculatus]
MTKGIAGIGKTVSVKKFILDWANGKTNTQLDFIFVLPFRELNLVDNDQLSLETLVKDFHLELKNIAVSRIFANHKILFIFDGLDESQLELNFKKAKRLTDPTKESSVDTIVTNLIREHLLPSALVWITSRPGAVQRIPREYVHQMTEVTGFKDEQKKEYFMKRFNDQIVAQKIVEIITTSRSLFIMCHIPIFCWIASKVLAHLLEAKQDNTQNETTELPTTLTEMYTYFLSIHLQKETEKYNNQEETDEDIFTCNKDFILKLGRMAFESLKEQKLIFNANDLKSYSLDVQKAGIYCGLCTEILKQENPVQKKKKFYCFVHLTVQEYFAALFVYNCFATKTIDSLSLKDFLLDGSEEELKSTLDAHPVDLPLDELIEISIANSTSRKTGELDMFLRFLIGLSLQKTQELLQGLIQQTENHSSVVEEIKSSLRDIDLMDCSPERCLNLVHCWLELKDSSLQQDLQEFLKPNHSQETPLTPVLCSVLAYTLLISKEPLDEFNLQKYKPSHRGIFRLIPAVRNCRKAMGVESLIDGLMNSECKLEGLSLSGYGLEAEEELADVVKSLIPSLKELELSGYITRGRIYSVLSDGLGSLEKLRLNQNGMITGICKELVTSFTSNPCFLQELELSYTTFKDSEMEILCTGLMSTNCHLKMLSLSHNRLTKEGCKMLASPLTSKQTCLMDLDLSYNDLEDSGVEALCNALINPHCGLRILRLSFCKVTKDGCATLASSLRSTHCSIKELDLSFNYLTDEGAKMLTEIQTDSRWSLEKLNVDQNEECWFDLKLLRQYACDLTLDPDTAGVQIILTEDNRKATFTNEKQSYPANPARFDGRSLLCRQGLRGRHYWEAECVKADVGVAYNSIKRVDDSSSQYTLGGNEKSWCLKYEGEYEHNSFHVMLPHLTSQSMVGVYLDWPAGILSFFEVFPDTLTHLYTVHTTFTDPLYPGFSVDNSVLLCKII